MNTYKYVNTCSIVKTVHNKANNLTQYLVHYDVCIMHLMQGKTLNQGFWSAPYFSGLKFLNGGVRGSKKIATAAEMLIISMVALALKKKNPDL